MSEHLKNKMYAHEVPPPTEAWDAIRQNLDAEAGAPAFAGRVYHYEAPPPPEAWASIVTALDAGSKPGATPVISLPARAVYRWIAAASVVVLFFSGVYYFTHLPKADTNSIASASLITSKDQPQRPVTETTHSRESHPVRTKAGNTLHPPHYYAHYPARKNTGNVSSERPLHSSPVEDASLVTGDQSVYIHARQILGESGEPIQDMSVINPDNDHYISITAPNGQQTRISSKLAIAMPYLGFPDAEQGDGGNWRQLIVEWREKILQSGLVPSSANFLDILEFTELIND